MVRDASNLRVRARPSKGLRVAEDVVELVRVVLVATVHVGYVHVVLGLG